MRWLCLIFLILVSPTSMLIGQEAEPSALVAYSVGAGDVLRVEAYAHEEISGTFAVETSGEISFPLLGRLEVEGLTTSEVASLLETLLEKDYYVDVQLQVEVEEYRSQPVTVLGEISRPGTYYLEGRTSLHKILAEAGGMTPTAGTVIEVRRLEIVEGVSTPTVQVFSTMAVRSGEEGRDVILLPGDVVSVSEKQRYFITGEIAQPGQYDLSPGMTLMQAVSQAGGQGKFASQNVEIHRGADTDKEIFTYDMSQIRKGKISDPIVMAGDVLIVRRRFF
jgi:polysaccharide export outer membrane protein